MQDKKFNQREVVNVIEFLRKRFPLHIVSHLLDILVYNVLEVHHPYSCQMHQQPYMICIYVGKPSFIGEIFDDEFHERSISVLQVFERENPIDLPIITNLNVRLIMLSTYILALIPLFTYIRDACC